MSRGIGVQYISRGIGVQYISRGIGVEYMSRGIGMEYTSRVIAVEYMCRGIGVEYMSRAHGCSIQRATLGSRLLRNSKDAGNLFYLSNHFFRFRSNKVQCGKFVNTSAFIYFSLQLTFKLPPVCRRKGKYKNPATYRVSYR